VSSASAWADPADKDFDTERTKVTRSAHDDQPPSQPLLRVVRGDATPEEIAALVAVLVTRAADGEAQGPVRSEPGSWSDRSRQLRRPLYPGPGAWRRSSLPS
jgi:hypothetical protein